MFSLPTHHCLSVSPSPTQASVVQLVDRPNQPYYCMEDYLRGEYMKHLDNHGGDEGIRNTPAAFAHFTYEASNKSILVCDIQGVGDLYTDPQIHTMDGRGFGKGNLGIDGMVKFLSTHECNAICRHLKLPISRSKMRAVEGTLPAKPLMDYDTISTLNTETMHTLKEMPDSVMKKSLTASNVWRHQNRRGGGSDENTVGGDIQLTTSPSLAL